MKHGPIILHQRRRSNQNNGDTHSLKIRKLKQEKSADKVMATVFWGRKGVLLVDFMPRGMTINSDRYYELRRKFQRAIQNI